MESALVDLLQMIRDTAPMFLRWYHSSNGCICICQLVTCDLVGQVVFFGVSDVLLSCVLCPVVEGPSPNAVTAIICTGPVQRLPPYRTCLQRYNLINEHYACCIETTFLLLDYHLHQKVGFVLSGFNFTLMKTVFSTIF